MPSVMMLVNGRWGGEITNVAKLLVGEHEECRRILTRSKAYHKVVMTRRYEEHELQSGGAEPLYVASISLHTILRYIMYLVTSCYQPPGTKIRKSGKVLGLIHNKWYNASTNTRP